VELEAVERPAHQIAERHQHQSTVVLRLQFKARTNQVEQFVAAEMLVPDHAVGIITIALVAPAAPDDGSIEAWKTEAEVVRVEALEDSGVRAAQDESAAGPKDAPHFAEDRSALRLRNVLEDLDTGDVVERLIGERQLRPVALPEIGLREIAARDLDRGAVDIDAR
jgi:hypothetical protein